MVGEDKPWVASSSLTTRKRISITEKPWLKKDMHIIYYLLNKALYSKYGIKVLKVLKCGTSKLMTQHFIAVVIDVAL